MNLETKTRPIKGVGVEIYTQGTVYDPPVDIRSLTPDERDAWIVSYLSGPIAEAAAGYDARAGARLDKRAVAQLMRLHGATDINTFSRRAFKLVEEHWDGIQLVAYYLSKRRVLTQAEVAAILAASQEQAK